MNSPDDQISIQHSGEYDSDSRLKNFTCRAPRANWKAWGNDEIATLSRMAGKQTSAQIGAALGRSSDSVKGMARILKISLRLRGEQCPWAKYSDAQTELARQMHDNGVRPAEISRQLGIPYWAIHSIVYYKRG